MSNRRIIDDQLYTHFITFGCNGRRKLLSLDQSKRIVLGVLGQELRRVDAKCVGFVLMPDHVHALIWFSRTGCLSGFMHEWKRSSSRLIREWYRNQGMRYFDDFDRGHRFWTPKYHSFQICEQFKLEEKLIYMHLNPVRAGLVSKAVDWAWSSARWYEQRKPVGVPIEWVN